ncbi:MAG: hypothetical protein HZC49_05565, partial [Nitrospirae bacterium]|nr:hypothetical protein [Nitrospirota bacterium]
MAIVNQGKHIRPLFFTLLILLLIAGCAKKETPKKVSLYDRTGEVSKGTEHSRQNTLWFSVDLRLGPKEDVNIYTPFLKYLEEATGRHFRIKLTERDEDTVKNLGKGVTHFAVLVTLNYVIGQNNYGIKYFVS